MSQKMEDDMLNHADPIAASAGRFWVVGGCYETLSFERLMQGSETVVGPFLCREDAESTWRNLSESSRSQATVRFTIAFQPHV
jgi:hypothetical protein